MPAVCKTTSLHCANVVKMSSFWLGATHCLTFTHTLSWLGKGPTLLHSHWKIHGGCGQKFPVLCSYDFYRSHEWNTYYLVTKNFNEVLKIWLNVSWPFSPQLGAFESYPHVSGSHLAECWTTPLDGIAIPLPLFKCLGLLCLCLMKLWIGAVNWMLTTALSVEVWWKSLHCQFQIHCYYMSIRINGVNSLTNNHCMILVIQASLHSELLMGCATVRELSDLIFNWHLLLVLMAVDINIKHPQSSNPDLFNWEVCKITTWIMNLPAYQAAPFKIIQIWL